ncbi:hypothetical protein LOK49_LG10G02648 [Camellia lanceoleosa]|uniref:Uncharacterized protein n=1 Tax=Camellia lanceoleosa TaxID=1840588 RepID=A0ACC0GD82_9ERIC|nr:hypothetical protein LOK49_LG10G02648 [Camellia lanceoleosa]
MEKHEECYLELFLQRNNQRKEYLDSMKKLEERARKYYANPIDHLNSDEFVKMMLNDACFVIEFLVGIHEYFLVRHQHQLRQQGQRLQEIFFSNIIVYEQHSSDDEPKYFTGYTFFMDLLIKSKEDVNKLCRNKIIDNMLGDDEAALIFKNQGKGKIILQHLHSAELCDKVNVHCEALWYREVATLKHDYFKNIWVTVATFAAAFLLVLTLTQSFP